MYDPLVFGGHASRVDVEPIRVSELVAQYKSASDAHAILSGVSVKTLKDVLGKSSQCGDTFVLDRVSEELCDLVQQCKETSEVKDLLNDVDVSVFGRVLLSALGSEDTDVIDMVSKVLCESRGGLNEMSKSDTAIEESDDKANGSSDDAK